MSFAISIIVVIATTLSLTSAANYSWIETEHAIQNAIKNGVFSGCVLGIATQNTTIFKKAYGTVGPKRGFYSAPVQADMKFDLGYLTEPIALNPLLMDFFEKTIILPTNKVSFFNSDFNNNGKRYITFQNLLEHNSGTNIFYSGLGATLNGTIPTTSTTLMKAINEIKLEYTT